MREDRRRAQSGATLIELLVSTVVIGLALVLVVGVFSTGLLDATLAKRNTAVEAVVQYEADEVHASPFNTAAQSYSDCFATESPTLPQPAGGFGGPCAAAFTLRADVTVAPGPTSTSQTWTVTVTDMSSGGQVGSAISLYKANR